MYIDFPLDGNTLNPTVESLQPGAQIFSLLPRKLPGEVLDLSSKFAVEGLEARPPNSDTNALEAPGGARPAIHLNEKREDRTGSNLGGRL